MLISQLMWRINMFSGIVETLGIVNSIIQQHDCMLLRITPQMLFDDLIIGDSVSVNGVCLTVTALQENSFDVTVVPQTLRVTNLHKLVTGSKVNLERSLKVGARIGGHYVQGHVDSLGEIIALNSDGNDALIAKIQFPENLKKYVVNKGYITLDGMSITIIETMDSWLTVTFIPHTQQVTVVHQYEVGTKINIEVDILGKYVEKILGEQNTCHLT